MNAIQEAARLLPGHWHKGAYVDPSNSANRCGIGHIMHACEKLAPLDYNWAYCQTFLDDVLKEQYPDFDARNGFGINNFVAFNDHPDTTEDQVVAVMEKAAVRLDESML